MIECLRHLRYQPIKTLTYAPIKTRLRRVQCFFFYIVVLNATADSL
jgi:hypothetical protein